MSAAAPLDGLISFDALAQGTRERMAENGVVPAGNGVGSHDPVNHPRHYNLHPSGVECIEVVEHMNFCLGNAVKYLWRADHKNGTEDLEKAIWYLQREVSRRRKDAAATNARSFGGIS